MHAHALSSNFKIKVPKGLIRVDGCPSLANGHSITDDKMKILQFGKHTLLLAIADFLVIMSSRTKLGTTYCDCMHV